MFDVVQDKEPRRTADGFEEAVGVNHLGHFLLVNLLLDELKQSRVIFIGTETHNPGSIAGKIPPQVINAARTRDNPCVGVVLTLLVLALPTPTFLMEQTVGIYVWNKNGQPLLDA